MQLLVKPLFHFIDLLERRNIPYAIIGGIAVTLLAHQRFTKDPEDLVILKLLADRPVDRQDIEALVMTFSSLDWTHIEKWCRAWEIEDRLKILKDSHHVSP